MLVWMLLLILVSASAALLVGRAVRARKAAEADLRRRTVEFDQTLRQTRSQLEAIMRNSPAAIWAKDPAGVYLFANEAFLTVHRLPAQTTVVGLDDRVLFDAESADGFRRNDHRVMATGQTERFIEALNAPGESCHMLSVKFPLSDEAGNVFAVGGVAMDLSEQMRLQEEALALNQRLSDLNASLEQRVLARTYEAEATGALLRDVTDSVPGVVYQRRQEADGRVWFPFISAGNERLGLLRPPVSGDQQDRWEPYLPEDQAALEAGLKRAIETLQPQTGEYRMFWQDGSYIWLCGTVMPRREADGAMVWTGHSYDITARKQADARLEAAEKLLREITDNMPGLVFQFRMSETGAMLMPFISKGIKVLVGMSEGEIDNRMETLTTVVVPEDQPTMIAAIIKSVTEVGPCKIDLRINHAVTGERRWLRLNSSPVLTDIGPVWFGTMQDITDFKLLEQQLATAKEAAEAANRAKGEFLATMSHEIRTPMNAVLSFAYLGSQADPPPKLRQHFARIESSARALIVLIDDILDFSKVEAGKLRLEHTPFALSQVLDNLESVVGLRAQEKGLGFRIAVDADVPTVLVGDPLRLGQVLMNLGGNAVKFTRQGEVVVRVTTVGWGVWPGRDRTLSPVPISQTPANPNGGSADRWGSLRSPQPTHETMLEFSVRDTGIGLSQEQIAKLFQAFVQADSSTTREFGGTGLGLSISKQLVALMGGDIDIHSNLGQGSTFRFTARFALAPEGAVPALAAAADAASLAGLSVLVTDDHDINREVVSELLASADVRATLATSGFEAIAAAQAQRFDAIFMDLRMPGMDGIEATRRIRELEAASAQRTPIIALTANVMAPDRERCLAAGMDEFVGKPIVVDELFAALARVTGRAGTAPPLALAQAASPHRENDDADHDFDRARRRVSRMPELYEHLAQRFVHGEDLVDRLRAQLAPGAPPSEDAAVTAHTLKGFAAQVGALRVSQLAAEIETALARTHAVPSSAALDELAAALAEARRRLTALPASAPATAAGAVDAEVIARLSAQLEQDLKDDEDTAWDRFEALSDALPPAEREKLAPVGRLIASLDYEQALTQWRALRADRG